MSDTMQPIDETLDDESLDAVDAEATEAYEEVEEFDPFEDMSDEELDALCDEDDGLAGFGDVEPGFRSGFVALVGRPNAGKSTLLNACYGKKVAIPSPVAQTTRRRMRAVVNTEASQLVIMDTPGNDPASVAAMVAGGAQVIVFSSGRGSPVGHPIAPVVKVTGNKITFANMEDNIDFCAAPLIYGEKTVEQLGTDLLNMVVETACGKQTKAEALGFVETAIARICNYV